MNNIFLDDGGPRGFLSSYICILSGYRRFVGREHIHPDKIKISPLMLQQYGNATHWFDIKNMSEIEDGDIRWRTDLLSEISEYPSLEELNLCGYIKFIPYNERLINYLNRNFKYIHNCFGVHYRGSDHGQAKIQPEVLFKTIKDEFVKKEYEQVFICTDEIGAVEWISEYFVKQFNFKNIIYNDTIKTDSRPIPLFLINFGEENNKKKGDEVLLDAHMLSQCDFVVGKASNIITYARLLNMALEGVYLDNQTPRYFFE